MGRPDSLPRKFMYCVCHHPDSANGVVLGIFAGHGVALSVYLGTWAAEVTAWANDIAELGPNRLEIEKTHASEKRRMRHPSCVMRALKEFRCNSVIRGQIGGGAQRAATRRPAVTKTRQIRRQDAGGTTVTRSRLYEADGAQGAKHVCRAQHAVPLRRHAKSQMHPCRCR